MHPLASSPFQLALITIATLNWSIPPAQAAGEPVHAYVSVGGENRIAHLVQDAETGRLDLRESLDLPGSPGSLAPAPDHRHLYAALRSARSVATLVIHPRTGTLQVLDRFPVVENPVFLATDGPGRNLFMASYNFHVAAVYPVRTDGRIAGPAAGVWDNEKNPHSIRPTPDDRWVFVPNTGADRVFQYRWDAPTARLIPNQPPTVAFDPGTGPRHFCFHPTRNRVYFVNEKGSSVTACRLDPDSGRLSPFQTLSTLPEGFTARNSCADIHITPDGRYLYASNRGHDSLAAYRVDPKSGALTALGRTPTEKTPREFDIDPDGRTLVAAGQGSGRLAVYRLDPATGLLERIQTMEIGKAPAWVTLIRLEP